MKFLFVFEIELNHGTVECIEYFAIFIVMDIAEAFEFVESST